MPDGGRGDPPQLRLPQAPRFDKYGMHAPECECAKCDLGMRPSNAERDAARRAWDRLEALKAAKAATPTDRAAEKARRRRKAFAAEERFTDQLIAKLSAPVKEPATPEQLAELKRQYPNLNRRKPR